MSPSPPDQEHIREQVRAHYAAAATSARRVQEEADCCGADGPARFGARLYAESERAELPQAAVEASLGCGNPTAVADLRTGDRVLDLGSGGGIDLLLSARRVGSAGKVHGLDMTEEMLALARRNLRAAGVTNVELLKGMIEAIPLPAATVDVVISNCVVNLSTDKPAVFAEVFRVLKPGGRVGISDVVADADLTTADRAERGNHEGCVAGALSVSEYRDLLDATGFEDVAITLTHQVADRMHGAIVQATKPRPTEALDAVVDDLRPGGLAGRA
jgi:arsenite methyltransferase